MGCTQSSQAKDGKLSKSERLRNYRQDAALKTNLVQTSTTDPYESDYVLVKQLGVGSMGSVASCRKKDGSKDTQLYACKTIRKSRMHNKEFLQELRNEINIVSRLDHPHIVKFLHVYYGPSQISIVMELCSGGDLYKRAPYTEASARAVLVPVLHAVTYMHDQGYIHRDLKMENIMFNGDVVKIIDFGLSCRYQAGRRLRQVGTLQTMAPEVFSGEYNEKCDVWSVGVIAFEMICGHKPFAAVQLVSLLNEIAGAKYQFKAGMSKDSKDFLQKLLQKDPAQRLSTLEAMDHEWLQPHHEATAAASSELRASTKLQAYSETTTLQKVASLVVAHQQATLSNHRLRAWQAEFLRLDRDGTGVLSLDEFRHAMQNDMETAQVDELFASMDAYGDGVVSYTEFLAAVLLDREYWTEECMARAFDELDASGSGTITVDDLKSWLGRLATPEHIDRILNQVSKDSGKKSITLDEFMDAFHDKDDNLVQEIVEQTESERERMEVEAWEFVSRWSWYYT